MSTDEAAPPSSEYDPATLTESEKYWKGQYEWLNEAGYRLRSRYSPDWEPSWSGTKKEPLDCEDSQMSFIGTISHAVRLQTGKFVVLKRVTKSKYPKEEEIMRFLSEESLASDPENHAIQPIDILQHPEDEDTIILVIPLLRDFDDPPFETMGEAVDFIVQLFISVKFLHDQRVVHGDVSINNVLMDASGMYPSGFHPCDPSMKVDFSGSVHEKYTRTEKPPRYYIIDFGLSRRYSEDEAPLTNAVGTDITVPEYKNSPISVNPFPVDVYCVGNMIRSEFLDGDPRRSDRNGYYKFAFLRPLIDDMTQEGPEKRPTMEDAVTRLRALVEGLGTSTLREQCIKRGDELDPGKFWFQYFRHRYKRLIYVIRRLPPVPSE